MIDYDLDQVSHTNPFIGFIHLMASPRTVRAVLVYSLIGMIVIIVMQGTVIPELLKSSFLIIVGTFFEFVRPNGKTQVGIKPTPLPADTTRLES